MDRSRQVTVTFFIVAFILLGAIFSPWGNGWLTILAIEVIAVVVAIELLSQNLPRGIQIALIAFCTRLDGSWSARREAIAEKAIRRFKSELLLAFVFLLIPANFLLLYVDTQLIPFSAAFHVLSEFEMWPSESEADIDEAKKDIVHQAELNGMSPRQIDNLKRTLLHTWPAILAVGIALFALAVVFFKVAYLQALKTLYESIQDRDLDWDDMQFRDLLMQRCQQIHAPDSDHSEHDESPADQHTELV